MLMLRSGQVSSATVTGAPAPKRMSWGQVGAVADRLFASSALEEAEPVATAPVLAVLGGDRGLTAAAGSEARACASLTDAGHYLSNDRARGQALVVNLDSFASLDDAVVSLMAFRRDHPQVTVVIASRSFQRDDLSPERRVIADASLRLPTSSARLGLAISHAKRHNQAARRDN